MTNRYLTVRSDRTRGRSAASVLAVLLLGPAGSWQAPPAASARPTMTTEAAAGQMTAAVLARRSGVPVTVAALTTQTRLVLANPDGSFTARVNDGPVRFKTADGMWRDIDNTLVATPDGTVTPVANPQRLVLSGGAASGDNVLASLGVGGSQLAIGWRGALPVPELSGSTATYRNVRTDLDLVVSMTRTGFEQNLVVHTPAALATLTSVAMPWRTGNLAPSMTDGGGLSLRGPGGERVAVPPARMWDAAVSPGSGNPVHTAAVGVAVTPALPGSAGWPATLTLRPATDALAPGSGWQFPVTIDPGITSTLYSSWDTYVQKDANDDHDNSSSTELRIGMEDDDAPPGAVLARSYIHWGTSFLSNATVSSATLYLYNFHSWICAGTYTNWAVYRTSATSSSTRWASAVSWFTSPAAVASTLTKGASGCSAGFVTANVATMMAYAASNHLSTFDMGIKASTETRHDGWKKFSSRDNPDSTKDPYISVTYNHTPATPVASALTTSGKVCVTGSARPGITTIAGGYPVTKLTPITDADPGDTETVKFYLAKVGSPLPTSPTYQVTGATAGGSASATIPSTATLTEGVAYQWQVKVSDASAATSGGSAICEFVVDNVGPAAAPTVTSTVFQDCTINPSCDTAGAVGVASPITFDAHGDTDVAKYTYWWDRTATVKTTVATTAGAAVTTLITPPFLANSGIAAMRLGGQAELDIVAVDAVGHESPVRRFSMLVGSAPSTAASWNLDEPAGATSYADAVAGGPALVASATGVTAGASGWGGGGRSAGFDGVTGQATAPATISTTGSFTVSAWVRLSSNAADNDAVSQYSPAGSSYDTELRLGYVKASNAWCFNSVCGTTAPVLNTWTQLVGVRNAATGAATLYIDGVLARSATQTAAYPATGTFVVGSGYAGTGSPRPWHGSVDQVQLWNRILDPAEVAVVAAHLAGEWDLTAANPWDTLGQHDLVDEGVGAPVAFADPDHASDGGTAAGFDGTDALQTSGPLVTTSGSMSVSAWVYLTDNTQYRVAVGQDGARASGFKLGASPTQGWLVVMPDSDTDNPTQTRASVGSPAPMNTWAFLTGVYDAGNGTLTLYLNGVIADSVTIAPRTWNATGALSVGRTRWTGIDYNWWAGDIESVRLYAGAIGPDLVKRLYLGELPPTGIA